MDGQIFQIWRFFKSTHGFFLLILFKFKTNSILHSVKRINKLKHKITLLQENQASTIQEYGGSQGNCLGTDNKLGEDVVFLNVAN